MPDRFCHSCGELYYRRNITEVWMIINGKLQKERRKTCLKCSKPDSAHSRRLLMVATVIAPSQHKVRRSNR